MVYITLASSKRVIKNLDFNRIKGLKGEIYKKPIFSLSDYEKNRLLALKQLFHNSEDFISNVNKVYCPLQIKKDTYKYVFLETTPAYHNSETCEKLHSDFINFVIPYEIKDRALRQGGETLLKEKVIEFRSWFSNNLSVLQENPSDFVRKLDVRWNVQRKPEEIIIPNSGMVSFDNYNLEALERRIDGFIKLAGQYYNQNIQYQSIIQKFQKKTFLAYTSSPIQTNDTKLNDVELKQFLKEYDETFKKPICELLPHYFRLRYNPALKFEGKLLDRLNFHPCHYCCK